MATTMGPDLNEIWSSATRDVPFQSVIVRHRGVTDNVLRLPPTNTGSPEDLAIDFRCPK